MSPQTDETTTVTPDEADPGAQASKRKMIIDSDTAGEDAAAILLAAENDGVDILGVTVLAGNVAVENSARKALEVLERGVRRRRLTAFRHHLGR